MLAVGTDAVAIARFHAWQQYSMTKLRRIFSQEELDYCFATPVKAAERLAVRFAAREAFFKALHALLPEVRIPLLTVMHSVCVKQHPNGAPFLQIDWLSLQPYVDCQELEQLQISVSLTHTHEVAFATVILSMHNPQRL